MARATESSLVKSTFKNRALALFWSVAASLSPAAAGEIAGIRFGETSVSETRVVLDVAGDIATAGDPISTEQTLTVVLDAAASR
jgi:hypothetical protein